MSQPRSGDQPATTSSFESPSEQPRSQAIRDSLRRYWRKNITIMIVLLCLWAFVGLGCGILFADVLNQFKLGGVPLGFWFAQQGSIITFVLIILVYALFMNALDKKHHRELEALSAQIRAQASEDQP